MTRWQKLKNQTLKTLYSFLAVLAGLTTSLLIQAVVSGWTEAQVNTTEIMSDWDETAVVEKASLD